MDFVMNIIKVESILGDAEYLYEHCTAGIPEALVTSTDSVT